MKLHSFSSIFISKLMQSCRYWMSITFNERKSFQFEPEQKKTCGDESHEKENIINYEETKHIYDSAANVLHIRIGNLNWCKCEQYKNEIREVMEASRHQLLWASLLAYLPSR